MPSLGAKSRQDRLDDRENLFYREMDDCPHQPGSDENCGIGMEMQYILIRRLLAADATKYCQIGDTV